MARTEKTELAKVYPIPLVGSHTTRTIASSTSSFISSGIVGMGILGAMIVGNSSGGGNQDQRYVNAIPDKITNPLTGKEAFYVYKRPGFETHITPAAGSVGTAIKIWTGQGGGDKLISAFGATNTTLYSDTTALTGGGHATISGVVENISETVVGTTPTIVANTTARAYYYPDGGSLTEIVDADWPGTGGGNKTLAGGFVHLDGYSFILCTDGTLWNSDLNSISAWTATSFLTTGMYPDKGVGLARYKDLIVAFGRESIEMFRNVGNPSGSPLQRISEAFIKIGCISSTSICQLEDNIAWVGASDVGTISVYVLEGFRPIRISTPVIDTQLTLRGSTTIYLTSVKIFGKTYIFVQAGSLTFVYCVEDQMWHEWSGIQLWHKFAASTYSGPVVYSISRTLDTGKVYKLNQTIPVYTDDGISYTFLIQTAKLDLQTERRKRVTKLAIVGDSYSTTNPVSVSWSDDDYQSFTTARQVDMVNNRTYLTNCGMTRKRAFRITNTTTVPIRLERLELEIAEGLH